MYNTIRDLTFISNYFDEKGNTKIANKLDKISLDLIENNKKYNNWIKVASKNRDKIQNQSTKELIDIIKEFSNTESIILAEKNNKLNILYKGICFDLAQKLKSSTFKEASIWTDAVDGLKGLVKSIFTGLFGSFDNEVQQEVFARQIKRMAKIIKFVEDFYVKANQLKLNSLALAQLENSFLSRLHILLNDFTKISTDAAAKGNVPLYTLTKGLADAIRRFISGMPVKDQQYVENLKQPVAVFINDLRTIPDQSAQVMRNQIQQTQQTQQNRPPFQDTPENQAKSFERFLNRAHTTRERAENFALKNRDVGKSILEALGIEEEWYNNKQIDIHSKWPEAYNYKPNEETRRKQQFMFNLRNLIERYPTEIWPYLNELGMTAKGSWRQEGYERGLKQR